MVLLTWFVFFTKCSLLRVLFVLVDGPVKVDRVLCRALLYLVVPLCISAASPLLCPRVGRGGSAVDQCVVALAAIVGGGTGRRGVGRGLEKNEFPLDPGKKIHFGAAFPSPKFNWAFFCCTIFGCLTIILFSTAAGVFCVPRRRDLILTTFPPDLSLSSLAMKSRIWGSEALRDWDWRSVRPVFVLWISRIFKAFFEPMKQKKSCLVVHVYPELDRLVRHVLEVNVHIFPEAVMHGIDQELPGPCLSRFPTTGDDSSISFTNAVYFLPVFH